MAHDVIQKTVSNREALKVLNARLDLVTKSIVNSLKGKKDSQVPQELSKSLSRLAECVFLYYVFSIRGSDSSTEAYSRFAMT